MKAFVDALPTGWGLMRFPALLSSSPYIGDLFLKGDTDERLLSSALLYGEIPDLSSAVYWRCGKPCKFLNVPTDDSVFLKPAAPMASLDRDLE